MKGLRIITIILVLLLNFSCDSDRNLGKIIIQANFIDDRSRLDLTLYTSGKYIVESNWLFGVETFEGEYVMHGDTIDFKTLPVVDNNLVSKTIIRRGNKIYFYRFPNGSYDTSLYYFTIEN